MSNNEDVIIDEKNKKDEEAGTELKKNEMQSKENQVKELEKNSKRKEMNLKREKTS